MSASEFVYLKKAASSPIIEKTNHTLFYFARSLLKRSYEHARPRIENENWDRKEEGQPYMKESIERTDAHGEKQETVSNRNDVQQMGNVSLKNTAKPLPRRDDG
jgi:hypothetical protein